MPSWTFRCSFIILLIIRTLLKVIVCNSLEELHSFIDKSQLTPDLGGSIQYCHTEWISQREDLEKLSDEMKDVSAKLDNFTRKIQETEVPKQAEAVQELLTLHVSCRFPRVGPKYGLFNSSFII